MKPKKKQPPQAYNGPVISMEEIRAMLKQHGPIAGDVYLQAEAFRRRLEKLGPPVTEEEDDQVFKINSTLQAVNDILRGKSPDYARAASIIKGELSPYWETLVRLRNWQPALDARTAAINGRRKQAQEQANDTRDKVRAREKELRAEGKPERAITKTIMLELGLDRKTVEKYRTKLK